MLSTRLAISLKILLAQKSIEKVARTLLHWFYKKLIYQFMLDSINLKEPQASSHQRVLSIVFENLAKGNYEYSDNNTKSSYCSRGDGLSALAIR